MLGAEDSTGGTSTILDKTGIHEAGEDRNSQHHGGSISEAALSHPNTLHSNTNTPHTKIISQESVTFALRSLRTRLNPHLFRAYIEPLAVSGVEVSALGVVEIALSASSGFLAVYVERNLKELLVRALAAQLCVPEVQLIFTSDSTPSDKVFAEHKGESSVRSTFSAPARTIPHAVTSGTHPRRQTVIHANAQQHSLFQNAILPNTKLPFVKPFPAEPFPKERAAPALTEPAQIENVPVFEAPSRYTSSSAVSSSIAEIIPAAKTEPFAIALNPRYTFENFVVGTSNEFCNAAARQVAENPGQSYNPLFIYGGVGLGKTHLLHAIGNEIIRRNPAAKVLYLSSESFTNELIQALRHDKMGEFKQYLRTLDALLIDDIQFISGKERTQEEFFHTFNALYSAKKQIVITSDTVPQQIDGLEERLSTRFSWGLAADLQSPDYETRVAILKRKAAADKLFLPEDVAHLLSECVSLNVRELEGALNRLFAVSSLRKTSLNVELAEVALRPLMERRPVALSVTDIKKAITTHFNLKATDLVSKQRSRMLAFPRHIAMNLCRKHTTTSYPEIGREFGGRDHSSVIHAANAISLKVAQDKETRELVQAVEKKLLGTASTR